MTDAASRSAAVFPAASNGEFNLPLELAVVLSHGKGCRLWTTEGRELLDFSMGWGSALVGHACPEVDEAVQQQLGRGANFAYVNEHSLALAEQLVEISPACDQVRYCASGTEATMYCMRIARASTGRRKILKFEGAYHGSNEEGVSSLFPSNLYDFPVNNPSSAGIAPGAHLDTLIAPFNDFETTRNIIEQHREELAGIIVEPLQRCLPPADGFLEGLRSLTAEYEILLIFDEVVTGFRLALGGAQEAYGVVPDLVAYGKALGGGLPIGVFGGRRDLMELIREDQLGQPQYVWMASTLGGNPISTAAAGAALQLFRRPGTYEKLHTLGEYLREGMRSVLEDQGIEGQILGAGPLAQVAFTAESVFDYRTTLQADKQLARQLMLELFRQGIFLNPMGTKLYLSLAHERSDCDAFCDRFADALSNCLKQTATA